MAPKVLKLGGLANYKQEMFDNEIAVLLASEVVFKTLRSAHDFYLKKKNEVNKALKKLGPLLDKSNELARVRKITIKNIKKRLATKAKKTAEDREQKKIIAEEKARQKVAYVKQKEIIAEQKKMKRTANLASTELSVAEEKQLGSKAKKKVHDTEQKKITTQQKARQKAADAAKKKEKKKKIIDVD